MYDPLLTRLASGRDSAISSVKNVWDAHTNALAAALGQTAAPVNQAYQTSIQQSAAINDAVKNALQQTGVAASGDLSEKLKQIGAPDQGTSQVYQNAAGSGFTGNSAALQALVSRAAEQAAMSAKEPGFARAAASKDLAAALSDLGQEYGQREGELEQAKQERAYDLFGNLVSRDDEQKQAQMQMDTEAIKQASDINIQKMKNLTADKDRLSKERIALNALMISTQDKRLQRQYQARQKTLDRQSKENQKALDRAAKEQHDIDSANTKAELQQRQQEFQATQNQLGRQNQVKIATLPGKKGNQNDNWQTPGSAKRNRVLGSLKSALINPDTGTIRQKFSENPDQIDRMVWQATNAAIVAQGINPESPAGKQLRKAFLKQLAGTPVKGGGRWTIPKTWKIAK